MTITKQQTEKMTDLLKARHGDAVEEISACAATLNKIEGAAIDKGCRKILFFPLYPHYVGATSATAMTSSSARSWSRSGSPTAGPSLPTMNIRPTLKPWRNRSSGLTQMEQEPDILVCSHHGVKSAI